MVLIPILFSCKDNKVKLASPNYIGGKGGDFNIAVFTQFEGKGKSSRIYLKYASVSNPSDTSLFEEKSNTIIEPGYGPHAHFNLLKIGAYYIMCSTRENQGQETYFKDTVIYIKNSTPKSQDIYLHLIKR